MIKKELNLFTVYKSGNTSGESSAKPFLILIAFIILVGFIFGVLFFMENQMKSEIAHINAELSTNEVKEVQKQLALKNAKNSALNLYNFGVVNAKLKFDESRFLTLDFFNVISESLPTNITLTTFSSDALKVQMTVNSIDASSAPLMKKKMEETGFFQKVSYNSVTKTENRYNYIMVCEFN